MSDFDYELSIQVELLHQRVSEVFRGASMIVNIPLKPILQTDVVNFYIEFQNAEAWL